MTKTPIIHVVDDDPGVLKSLPAVIEAMGYEAETYASGEAFLGAYDPLRPGCVILDFYMPGMNGPEVLAQLAERESRLPVIMVTAQADVATAVWAMKQGIVDFLEKPYRCAVLRESIETAIRQGQGKPETGKTNCHVAEKIAQLSAEEQQILKMMVDGQPNKAIAATLGVSLRTFHSRRAGLMRKMQAQNRTSLLGMVLTTKDALSHIDGNARATASHS